MAAQTSDIRAELSTIKQVLLLSAQASASSLLLENGGSGSGGGGGNRLALMAAGVSSSLPGVVEALPTPTPTPTKGQEEGTAAAAAAAAAEGTESAFSSPAKEQKEEGQGEEEEEEEQEQEPQESEEARAAREAAEAARLHQGKLRRLCAALKAMRAGNEPAPLHEALDMLLIYVNNLIKYPTVPRCVRLLSSVFSFGLPTDQPPRPRTHQSISMDQTSTKSGSARWRW